MAVSRENIRARKSNPATETTTTGSAKAASSSKNLHPAYQGKQGLKFDFTVENYSGRIFRKMGQEAFKLKPLEADKGVTRFAGKYSNGNLPVLLNSKGKPVANPDKIYYTQMYELDAQGRFVMTLLVGPDSKEANNAVWVDKLVFRMSGKRTQLERIDPYGNVAKGSYTSIQNGEGAGLDFGGIDPARLYPKVEQAARSVLSRYFDSPAHLLENLTRESTGSTLNASTYAQHGLNFQHDNFYTRNFRYFGLEKIHTYQHSENSEAERYEKTNSVGLFPVYKGEEERWYVTQVFRYGKDGILTASNSLTNYPGPKGKSEAKEPIRLTLRLVRDAQGAYKLTSLMIKGDTTVYSDALTGTQEEITEQAKASRKLAWKFLDMPIERSLRLFFRGVEAFESAKGGNEEVETPNTGNQGTATGKRVISSNGSGNFTEGEAQAFLVPANAGKELNFYYDYKGIEFPITYKVTERGAFSAYFGDEMLEICGVTAKVTLGAKFTITVTSGGETYTRAKNAPAYSSDNELATIVEEVSNRIYEDMQPHVGKETMGAAQMLLGIILYPVATAFCMKRDGVTPKVDAMPAKTGKMSVAQTSKEKVVKSPNEPVEAMYNNGTYVVVVYTPKRAFKAGFKDGTLDRDGATIVISKALDRLKDNMKGVVPAKQAKPLIVEAHRLLDQLVGQYSK